VIIALLFLASVRARIKHREYSSSDDVSYLEGRDFLMSRIESKNSPYGSQEDLSIFNENIVGSDDLLADMQRTDNIRLYGFRTRNQSGTSQESNGFNGVK
jgi:hypothetical protein